MLRIASFDIGKKNFAFYIEECNIETIKSLKEKYLSLQKKFQRRVKGEMNDYIQEILNDLHKSSKRIEMGVFDIRDDKNSNDLDIKTRINMHILLEKYSELWDTCHFIIIEQQYFNISKGKNSGKRTKPSGANVDAIKLGECCLNWFLIQYSTFKKIIEFSSVFKTHTLGAPEGLTKTQRKKWSIEKAHSIFEMRGDIEAIELMKGYKNSKGKKQKLDDVCDCLIQLEAFVFLRMIVEK